MSHLQHIPIRYDYYLWQAESWSKLLQLVGLGKKQVVLELCSGWSPKIGLALLLQKFEGRLVLQDADSEALGIAQTLLEQFDKQFAVDYWQADALSDSGPEVDVIVMNHVLDDILLFSIPEVRSGETPYADLTVLAKLWQQHAEMLSSTIPLLAEKLARNLKLQLKPEGMILLRQYAGYQEKLYRLDEAMILTERLRHELNTQLQQLDMRRVPVPNVGGIAHDFADSLDIWQSATRSL